MRGVIVQSSSYHGHLLGPNKGPLSISVSSSSVQGGNTAAQQDSSGSTSSRSEPSQLSQTGLNSNGPGDSLKMDNTKGFKIPSSEVRSERPQTPSTSTNTSQGGDNYWRTALNGGKQGARKQPRTHTIVVTGPAGYIQLLSFTFLLIYPP
jgi:hypothetical protein